MKKDKLISFRTTTKNESFLKKIAEEDRRSISFVLDLTIKVVRNINIKNIKDLENIKINNEN